MGLELPYRGLVSGCVAPMGLEFLYGRVIAQFATVGLETLFLSFDFGRGVPLNYSCILGFVRFCCFGAYCLFDTM